MIIGLTGRVGTGKSHATALVASHFSLRVIDLDLIGHALLKEPTIMTQIQEIFGSQMLNQEGQIDRPMLGNLVFKDKTLLQKLNQIMHPKMNTSVRELCQRYQDKSILISGALIDEIGLRDLCDCLIVIDAEDIDIQKAVGVKFTIAAIQKTRQAYLDMADAVIINKYDADFDLDVIRVFGNIPAIVKNS